MLKISSGSRQTGWLISSMSEDLKLGSTGTAERILKWGAENERRSRELVGGSRGILPQKILKSRVSEIVFTAFSARYFLKYLAWIKRKMKGTFSAYSNILEAIS